MRRNFCRTGVLKNRLRTSIVVPTGQPHGRNGSRLRRRRLRAPRRCRASAVRLRITSRLTSAIDASASPRKPSVPTRNRSSASANLAGGVAGHGQRQLVGRDAAAVVDDADQLAAALLHRHVDPRRAGVERVLDQLLDDARRPLDHLARGDLVDDARRELADRGHREAIR